MPRFLIAAAQPSADPWSPQHALEAHADLCSRTWQSAESETCVHRGCMCENGEDVGGKTGEVVVVVVVEGGGTAPRNQEREGEKSRLRVRAERQGKSGAAHIVGSHVPQAVREVVRFWVRRHTPSDGRLEQACWQRVDRPAERGIASALVSTCCNGLRHRQRAAVPRPEHVALQSSEAEQVQSGVKLRPASS